jgi:pimeloyl-ACP methyl ester carboxylesterase
VLFLPGIQASRLYKDGLFGIEDRVWEPNSLFSNDVRDLSMNEDGESEKEIYTRDVIDRAVGTDVYRDFLEMLEEQKTATVPIKDFVAFAYDWRFSVTDIIQNGTAYEEEIKQVQAEVERLAAESHSGQVTIIAHSNGGLLAKALIRSLEAVDKEHLVDRLVFLGTPQLGTPKAIATLLHGYDQSDAYGGLIISAGSARTVANNLPGLYALLPSERYVAEMTGPIIRFEQGTPTDPYRSLYGSEINSFLQYQTFLYGSDVFDRGLDEMVSVPTRVNPTLFNTAMQEHSEWMDAWEAPASIDVVEIVGVGLPTLSAITYRSIPERKCAVVGSGMILCVTEYDIKPYANFTVQGDETVVADSARGYVGDKQTFFVALNQLSDARLSSGLSAISHFNELPRRKRTGYQWSFELVKSEGVAWCICV